MARPDRLEKTSLSSETVKRVIAFRVLANETGKNKGLGRASDDTSSVHVSNVDLNGGMVLGGNQTTSSRALACIETGVDAGRNRHVDANDEN